MLLQIIAVIIIVNYVNGHNTKGSLTFVIDDTGSMYDDIAQVKEKTNQVFDAVLNANASKIDDFIIVTFNDPGTKFYTVTKDRSVFKKALAEITVGGGGDCPEYSMKGIELALEKSKPNSFFYVFTDAAAKDYEEYDRIKSLGLKKSIQVTFLLTGECYDTPMEGNAVYDKLAAATNGQVFHLEKQDVRKIIDYIIASIKHKKTTLAQKYFDNALKKTFQFSIDSKIWDVIISVSGENPTYHITDPDGNNVETKEFIDTEKSHISKLEAKPGVYTLHLESIGEVSAVITGSTSVCFQHGFSTVPPSSLNETSTKPIAGLPSYLSIALDNIDQDVSLDTIEIRDINDNCISEFPLTLVDKNQQFYVTRPLLTPNYTFKLAINGHTKTKEKITRAAPTTIEPQKPELEGPQPRAPKVTILEGAKITGEYDKPMTLKCKVNAFPKPDVIWQDNLKTVYSSTIVPVDLPYEYLSILKIDKINKNITIQCMAVNLMGENTEFIAVETKKTYFIKVIEFPKDSTFECETPAELNFKVNAFPHVKITWFKNGKQIKNNSDYEISSNGSRVVIRQMRQELKGNYTVEAYNDEEMIKHDFKIDMSGVVPVIDKSSSDYKAEKGSNVKIACRILKGKPTPIIAWKFKPETVETSTRLREVTETLDLNNVDLENMGTYTCSVQNEFGSDSHAVHLFVEYPPTIKKVNTQVKVPAGELVILQCKVDGSPFPFIRWFFNEVEINNAEKYIYNDNSLTFTGSIEDNGIYTCVASNSLGEAEKDFYVNIFIPIKILVPKYSKLEKTVGDSVNLECLTEGYPKPKLQWTFYSENPSIRPKLLRADSNGTLSVEHIQVEDEGFYRCFASNAGGVKSITYEIHVRAPVSILPNPLGTTTYSAVKGDLALRIPCNAIGSPKPVMTWETDGYNIASGTDWFDIEEDGTLIIKYPTLRSVGSYTCRARNDFSSDLKEYTVNVTPYPKLDDVKETLNLTIGTSPHIQCDLPHRIGDVVNWFKDGQLIASGELYLKNISMDDSGVYSCRVSTFMSAHTIHKNVAVGFKPIFTGEEDTDIDYIEGAFAYLDCSGYSRNSEPELQIIWKHNGNVMKSSDMDMTYIFEMNPDAIGSYECIVSNNFGNINRTFNIKYTKECLLDIEKDFNRHQPLLLSRLRQWPDFEKINNFLRIPKSTHFVLSCPGNTITYNEEEFGENVKAICIDNSIFKIRDRNVDFSKLKCKEEIKSLAKSTNQSCFAGNTDLLKVGFSLKRNLLEVYDVCIDKDKKIPLFTRHNLHQGISGALPKEDLKFSGSKYLPFIFDDMYKCSLQLKLIYLMSGNKLSSPNKCCFDKRQLVSPADVIPGLSQVATYNYLNVVPQWSTCGSENWDEIERRIRSLAMFSDINLSVFTGSSYPLTLPGQTSEIFLSDKLKKLQRVPMYIWKVVQNTNDKSSLAIIQLNIPNITLPDALLHMPCEDICDEVEWMKDYQWFDVDKGFTFCCSITEFASYFGTLFTGHDKVFKTIPLISERSLI